MIPYAKQHITQDDIEAVLAVLQSDFLTQGPQVPRFEDAVASYTGGRFALATNSATSALHVACLALGVGKGDIVWTSPISFVSSANCARFCGAEVDFVDIDPRSYNLSISALGAKLQAAENLGLLPKVVIPVHFCGQPCEMAAIYELSQRYGFSIIEDASHAIGGRYRGDPIGNGRYSDITVFSFHAVKIITTAEGGMALTNRPDLAQRMALLRSHGITRDPERMTHEPEGPWYYQQIALGFNYRMTDMHAALGSSQLTRVDDYVARRHVVAHRYESQLADLPVVTPWQHPDGSSAMHLYIVRLKRDEVTRSHREVFRILRRQGIGVNLHYIPVHLQPYYRERGFAVGNFPEAERYYTEAISLPMFPTLTDNQQDQVVDSLRVALR